MSDAPKMKRDRLALVVALASVILVLSGPLPEVSASYISKAAGAAAAFYQTVQDEGVGLTQRATIDFTGAGVTCADSGGVKTQCTIPGGGGSAALDVAEMTRNAAQSIATGGVPVKIAFDNVAYTYGASITADAVTNDRFDINTDGVYQVTCYWRAKSVNDGAWLGAFIYVNGASTLVGQMPSSAGTQDPYVEIQDTLDLNNGDFVEFYVAHSAIGARNTGENSNSLPRMVLARLR